MNSIPSPAEVVGNPERFASVFLRILDKQKQLTPLRWNKTQRHFHANRTGRDLVLKARQLGFSTYIQAEIYRRSVTRTTSAMTIAHDDELTKKLRLMADRFWENHRIGNIQPERKYDNSTMTTYPEYMSECTIAKAGSKEAGRGGTYTDIHGSEVAFWPDAEKLLAGAMQGGNPDIILESTPNGAQGHFYDLCMEAAGGNSIWTLHFYPWWWDEAYAIPLEAGEEIRYTDEENALAIAHSLTAEQIKWRRRKQKELKHLFAQEYAEDAVSCFLTSGNSYFGDLSGVFTAPTGATYNPDHKYYAGLDFAQTTDYLAMPVIDATAKVQVDLLRINKLSWAELRRRVKAMYNKWHCQLVLAESNSIGSVNIEALRDDKLNIVPFETTNANKAELAANFHDAIHDGGLKLLPLPVQQNELKIFVATKTASGLWRLAADGNGHDDTVIGLLLAWHCANIVTHMPDAQPEKTSQWMEQDDDLRPGWAGRY